MFSFLYFYFLFCIRRLIFFIKSTCLFCFIFFLVFFCQDACYFYFMEFFKLLSSPAELLLFRFIFCTIFTFIGFYSTILYDRLLFEIKPLAVLISSWITPRLNKNLKKLISKTNEIPFQLQLVNYWLKNNSQNFDVVCFITSLFLIFVFQVIIVCYSLLTYDNLFLILDLAKVDQYKMSYQLLLDNSFFLWFCPLHLAFFIYSSRDLFLICWAIWDAFVLSFGILFYMLYYHVSWFLCILSIFLYICFLLNVSSIISILPDFIFTIFSHPITPFSFMCLSTAFIICICSTTSFLNKTETSLNSSLGTKTGLLAIIKNANFDWFLCYTVWVLILLFLIFF